MTENSRLSSSTNGDVMATQKANDGSSERSSKEVEVFTVSNTVYADEGNKEMSVHNLSSQSM